MTYIRPDKKGLGLDVPGPDEPSYYSSDADGRPLKRRWWEFGLGPIGSVVMTLLWSTLAVSSVVDHYNDPHHRPVDWLGVVIWGAMAVLSAVSAIFYARSRRAKSAAAPGSFAESSATGTDGS